jgi:hypothetical protein
MTTPAKLPEAAQEEPRVLTPDQLAQRDQEAQERSGRARRAGRHADTAAPDSPLRDPGEMSSPPAKH